MPGRPSLDASLRRLVERECHASGEVSTAALYQRLSDVASRLSLSEAWVERCRSDPLECGTAQGGRLNRAGRRLCALRLETLHRLEGRLETCITARASLRGLMLHYCTEADEAQCCFRLSAQDRPDRAPKLLLAMTAARHRKASFRIWPARLSELDERALRTGLGPAALCVALVGYLPELQAEEYEAVDRLAAALSRADRRQRRRRAPWWRRWYLRPSSPRSCAGDAAEPARSPGGSQGGQGGGQFLGPALGGGLAACGRAAESGAAAEAGSASSAGGVAAATTSTTLLLVRHGETQANAAGVLQGQSESQLTARGRAQAAAVGIALRSRLSAAGVRVAPVVYTSDLSRAADTAQALADALGAGGQPPPALHRDERLRERRLGPFQGLSPAECARRFPATWAAFSCGDFDCGVRPPPAEEGADAAGGIEAVGSMAARCSDVLGAIAARHPGGTVVAVSHGGLVHTACVEVGGMDGEVPHISNGSVTTLKCDGAGAAGGAWRVEQVGEVIVPRDGGGAAATEWRARPNVDMAGGRQ